MMVCVSALFKYSGVAMQIITGLAITKSLLIRVNTGIVIALEV